MELSEQIFTIEQETWLFLGSCLLGIPVGMLLDLMRLLRTILPHHAAAVFLEDALLICFAAILVQCYATMFARGALRYYDALGCCCGFLIYLCTVGAVWQRMLSRMRDGVHRFSDRFRQSCYRIWQKMQSVFVRSPEKRKNIRKREKST